MLVTSNIASAQKIEVVSHNPLFEGMIEVGDEIMYYGEAVYYFIRMVNGHMNSNLTPILILWIRLLKA